MRAIDLKPDHSWAYIEIVFLDAADKERKAKGIFDPWLEGMLLHSILKKIKPTWTIE